MDLRPLTLADAPRVGREVLVCGSLSGWAGPARRDVAVLTPDFQTGELWWMGHSFRCVANVGSPAVTHWSELPDIPEESK